MNMEAKIKQKKCQVRRETLANINSEHGGKNQTEAALIFIKWSRKRIRKRAKQVTGTMSPVLGDRFLGDLQTDFRH